jgi:hypothetical protein
MTGMNDLDTDRRIADWLETGPTRLPEATNRAIRVAVHSNPRQRSGSAPWRYLYMPAVKAALGAAAIGLFLVGGSLLFRTATSDQVGAGPSAGPCAPSAQPAPSSSALASPAASPVDTSSWLPFTSPRYGYSMCYPPDWTIREGTDPLPVGSTGDFGQSTNDEFDGPGTIAFTTTSGPAPADVSEVDFLASYGTHGRSMGWPNHCWPVSEQEWESVVIDGHPAHLHGGYSDCDFTEVLAFVGGRLYDLQATPNATLLTGEIFDRTLFDAFLATARFDPSSADDSPTSGPAASPG